jgi:hypothetical protein
MSADIGMSYQARSTRQNEGSNGRGYGHGAPWKPVEILAMVLGFIVFWPIGLGVLGWKFWQKKSGYPGDIISFGREKWGSWATWARGSDRWAFAVNSGPTPVAWARPEIAPSTNGARLNSRGWKKNARSSSPPSGNLRNSWKISATPGIARSSSGSCMRIETKAARPGNRARSYNKRRLLLGIPAPRPCTHPRSAWQCGAP